MLSDSGVSPVSLSMDVFAMSLLVSSMIHVLSTNRIIVCVCVGGGGGGVVM